MRAPPSRLRAVGPAVLGFGLGGLVDGILLHQVLQWHHLVSGVQGDDTLEGLQRNLFWDGVFHAATLVVLVLGVAAVWLSPPPRLRQLLGWLLVGWGAFHVVDQLVFHLALGLHDIRQGVESPELYNWGFFAAGLAMMGLGGYFARRRLR
jgi:uncharacterized membrane protein